MCNKKKKKICWCFEQLVAVEQELTRLDSFELCETSHSNEGITSDVIWVDKKQQSNIKMIKVMFMLRYVTEQIDDTWRHSSLILTC